MNIENISMLIAAIVAALILFQSVFVAPAINKLLHKEQASVFLRYIWPKFFMIIGLLNLFGFIIELNPTQKTNKYLFLSSFIMMLVCYLVTPLINQAKDTSKNRRWVVLHFSTVLLTFIVLVLNILILCFGN